MRQLDPTKSEWFLIIDSRAFEIQVNCANIEEFTENKEQKLFLAYYLPGESTPGSNQTYTRKTEIYECCENELLLKTFESIKK
jgi:hypothetical protein